MVQKVYLNQRKAVILESPGCGARDNAWIFDVQDKCVVPSFPDSDIEIQSLDSLLAELHAEPTNLKLVLA